MMTVQQQAVIDAMSQGKSMAVRAVAGSGKTTTLIAGLKTVTTDGITLAFNKKNADELKSRLGASSRIEAKTLNALGHRVWSDHLRKRLVLDSDKSKNILRGMSLDLEPDEFISLLKLVSVAKARCITPGIATYAPPDIEAWLAGAQQIDIPDDLFNHLLPHAIKILQRSVQTAWEGNIDFDDQLYMPVLANARFPSYSLVAVDEAQDLSPLQHEMVARLSAKQIIVVGDPAQAIYGFRGASASSYDELRERFSLESFPLTVSFRCPQAVGREARRYVNDFQCVEGATEGLVRESHEPVISNGAIICRYNAPLIKLAFRALREEKPFTYLGRDFLSGLKSIAKKHPTIASLDKWLETRLREARTSGAKDRAGDQHASLVEIYTRAAERGDTPEKIISRLMDPSATRLTLCTVHKAKGLEWKQVQFLGYDAYREGGQEANINYVGVTRAQETLLTIPDRRR